VYRLISVQDFELRKVMREDWKGERGEGRGERRREGGGWTGEGSAR
jgi:hypothetical protein